MQANIVKRELHNIFRVPRVSGDDTNKNSDCGLGAEHVVSKVVYASTSGTRLRRNNKLDGPGSSIDYDISMPQPDKFWVLEVQDLRLEGRHTTRLAIAERSNLYNKRGRHMFQEQY